MKLFKRAFLRGITALALALAVVLAASCGVSAGMLHEDKKTQTVTSGVTYEEITRMYDSGWVDIYMLRVDLTNPNVKLDVLESVSEFGLKETVQSLAQTNGVAAAVNGDFFGSSTLSTSMGIVIRDGNIDETRNYYNSDNKTYAGIYIDNQNKPYIDYLKISHIGFVTNGSAKIDIDAKNKVTDMSRPVYIDKTAMTTTAQLDSRFKDLYKIVVENGRIADISAGGATKTVPENGYLIVMNYKTAEKVLKEFAVGDEASYVEYYHFLGYPELSTSSIKFGMSGGGKILENGEFRDGGLLIEPGSRHPRTAVGINQAKTEMIIVAIDGRSKNSMGATHYETYEIMRSLGAWDAFHLDGGGSTTILSRDEGQTGLTLHNTPSDGSQRKVANAIGVSSVNATGSLSGLYVSANGQKGSCLALAGHSVQLAVSGYDANYNPVPVSGVTFSQSGAGGSFSGNAFTPQYEGETVITAEYGGITGTITVKTLSKPERIRITPSAFTASVGETVSLKAELVNSDGYGIDITSLSSVWGVTGNIGVFEAQGKFKATANGAGTVSVSYGGLVGSASAAVGSEVRNLLDFETVENITYLKNDYTVNGNVAYTNSVKHDGNNALQINYDFKEKLYKKQMATIDFRNTNALITEKASGFAFWLTGDGANSMVTAVFLDGEGNEQVFGFPARMNNADWKYYYGKFADDVALPLKLSRITISSVENLAAPVKGKVFLDTLHAAYPLAPDRISGLSEFYDDYMRADLAGTQPSANEAEIAIFGPTAHISTPNQQAAFERAIMKMQQNTRLAVFAGYTAELPQMVTETLKWLDTYSVTDAAGARVITLATSKNGMRATNPSQWASLASDLNSSPHNNVIIVLNKDIWDNSNGFGDTKERDLLHKTLKEYRERTGANVLVSAGISSSTKTYIVDGVRYVTLNGLVSASQSPSEYNILRVRVSDGIMKYDLESLE